MAANDLMLFYQSEEQNREKMANTAPLHGISDVHPISGKERRDTWWESARF
jgi:hypothetical protein